STRFEDCLVAVAGSIRDAMLALDKGAGRISLAIGTDGRLAGVVTDGDIRRALLQGASLDDPLHVSMTRKYTAVGPGDDRAATLEVMRARRLAAVPVVDGESRPIGLHLLHEFLDPVGRPNWAVIMAGGKVSPLRPLTD